MNKGSDAIACKPGYAFALKFGECNYCTVNTLREIFGHCAVVECPDGGVLAMVRKNPYLWFPEYPTHCTCNFK